MRNDKIFILLVLLFLQTTAQAGFWGCLRRFPWLAGEQRWKQAESLPFDHLWHDEASFFKNFESFQSILVLADGSSVYDSRQVARHFPDKRVVGTDKFLVEKDQFSPPSFVQDLAELNNLERRVVDTQKPFPFLDNEFDLVFMKEGLCTCYKPGESCAGIADNREARRKFLKEVLRVLDKRKPTSMALLHGTKIRDHDVREWLAVCKSLQKQMPFRFEILRKDGVPKALRITLP